MAAFRGDLPQLSDNLFFMAAGLETELMFNHGVEIPGFATHALLSDPKIRDFIADYYRRFIALAQAQDAGFVLGSQTWKAHMHWADEQGVTEEDLRRANHDSVAFISGLRDEYSGDTISIVLEGVLGPRGDAYAPDYVITPDEAEAYHAKQIGWLAETEVDMVAAYTLTQSDEAIGVVRAARAADIPVVISFTLETDGCLPSGQPLEDAVKAVDQATGSGAAYFMVNCAHPSHFSHLLVDEDWSHRIHGVACNASSKSHAELNESETLDDGNPVEFGAQHRALRDQSPWLNIFGACCGCDLRHVTEIARALN